MHFANRAALFTGSTSEPAPRPVTAPNEHHAPHRRLDRITRILSSSRLITALAAPAAARRRRFTSSSTATACRWSH